MYYIYSRDCRLHFHYRRHIRKTRTVRNCQHVCGQIQSAQPAHVAQFVQRKRTQPVVAQHQPLERVQVSKGTGRNRGDAIVVEEELAQATLRDEEVGRQLIDAIVLQVTVRVRVGG